MNVLKLLLVFSVSCDTERPLWPDPAICSPANFFFFNPFARMAGYDIMLIFKKLLTA